MPEEVGHGREEGGDCGGGGVSIFGNIFGREAKAQPASAGTTDERTRRLLKQIAEQQRKIMAKIIDITASLNELASKLTSATEQIQKVGTETEALQARITELGDIIANGEAPAELVAAFEAVRAAAENVKAAAQAVDEKVPDAPTEPTN